MLTAPPTIGQAGTQLLVSLETALIFGVYWSPSLFAVIRRHPRMGLVILYNFLGVFAVPWIWAWVAVLGEPSRRPRRARPPAAADPAVVPFQRRPNGGAA